MVHIFFDKKSFDKKRIIRKLEKRKVYSSFDDDIWGADLADMQLSKCNKEFYYLLLIFIVIMHGFFLSRKKRYYNY